MERAKGHRRLGWTAAGLLIAATVTASCDDGCDEGTTNVCDEDGENCFCALDCEAHTDCPSGKYCLDIGVCVSASAAMAANGCGDVGEPCCIVLPDDDETGWPACLADLRCDASTEVCQP
jgi:hypothetical protein